MTYYCHDGPQESEHATFEAAARQARRLSQTGDPARYIVVSPGLNCKDIRNGEPHAGVSAAAAHWSRP